MKKNKKISAEQDTEIVSDELHTVSEEETELTEIRKKSKKNKTVDFISKIVCVIIAAVIWFYVMQVDSPEFNYTFEDVEIKLTGAETLEKERGLSIYSGYGRTVDVTVSGRKSIVGKFTADDIRVSADISDITESGDYQVGLNVALPDGMSLVDTEYEKIDVYADEKASTTVLLKAKIMGFTQNSEYEYGEPVCEFDSLVVSGPKTELDKIDYAAVEVDFSSMGVITTSTAATRTVVLINKDGEKIDNPYIKLSRAEAQVTVPVYTEKVVPLKIDWFYGYFNEDNAAIDISPKTVRVKGDPSKLANMDSITIASIDEKSIEGNIIKTYPIEPGADVTVINDTEARVSIRHIGTTTKTFRVTNFNISSGKNKAEAAVSYKEIVLRGPTSVLDELSEDDITIKADVSGYSNDYKGIVQTEAEVSIKGITDGSVYEIGFYSLNVKVND